MLNIVILMLIGNIKKRARRLRICIGYFRNIFNKITGGKRNNNNIQIMLMGIFMMKIEEYNNRLR